MTITLLVASASEGSVRSNELFIQFADSVVNLPSSRGSYLCDSTTIRASTLLSILRVRGASGIEKMFDDGESVTYADGPEGQQVIRPTLTGIYRLIFADSASAAAALRELDTTSGVLFANQNGMSRPHSTSVNDTAFHSQWSLKNTGQGGGTPGADIKISEAWDYEKGSPTLKIGVVDEGVKLNHEDLSGRVSGDGTHDDAEDHGTGVAGVIGALTNNTTGIAGINWNSQLLSRDVGRNGYDDDDIFNKVVNLVDQGVVAINNSWGATPPVSTVILRAFVYAYNMNTFCVASAGNNHNTSPEYPASWRGVICVAASDDMDAYTEYSHFGTDVDLCAPSGPNMVCNPLYKCIRSTTSQPGYAYAWFTGTSFSAPHVTGVASLLKSKYPNLYNDDIAQILYMSATDRGTPGWDTLYGWGRLDADSAFKVMKAPNSFAQYSASGGYNYSTTGAYSAALLGFGSPADGAYIVKRHDVRKDVTFARSYFTLPKAWGRGPSTTGYYGGDNPILAFKFGEVVPGTITGSGCTLRTFVYEAWDMMGDPVGWVPCQPSQVNFGTPFWGSMLCYPLALLQRN